MNDNKLAQHSADDAPPQLTAEAQAWAEKEVLRILQEKLADYERLQLALEALRQIPNWTRILLATDDEPYIVTIDETDVGGERILSTSADTLLAALEAAYAQYLLFNREYAAKVGKP